MKPHPYYLLIVNALLAVALTVISFQYVKPKNCYFFCAPSNGIPCPKGSCSFGDQKAGWPIPAFIDAPGGGSPTGGWGLLGAEDLPLPSMIADVLFYSILIWIVWFILQVSRRQAFSLKLFLASLPLNVLLGAFLWVFYLIFPFTMGFPVIGRGHRDAVYVQTSKDVDLHSAMSFAPRISVPLDEVIEYYGNPDYVWFTSDSTTQDGTTGLLLFWDTVNVFVELPQISAESYPVHSETGIERIIFYDGLEAISVAGQQMSEEKTAWRGYGEYRP